MKNSEIIMQLDEVIDDVPIAIDAITRIEDLHEAFKMLDKILMTAVKHGFYISPETLCDIDDMRNNFQ